MLCFRVLRSASGIYWEKAARVCVFGGGLLRTLLHNK
jgi:hypothetical protein